MLVVLSLSFYFPHSSLSSKRYVMEIEIFKPSEATILVPVNTDLTQVIP
jgi:hypothetical protein